MSRYPSQLCTFFVGDYHFGVDVLQVQEVLRFHEMTAVPLAPPVVRGLINLRGQIVTALDLRHRLGLQPAAPHVEHANVIVRTHDGAVSLLVDEVGDVIDNAGLELTLLNSSRESFEFIEDEGTKLVEPEPAVGVEHPSVPLVSKPARGFRRKG